MSPSIRGSWDNTLFRLKSNVASENLDPMEEGAGLGVGLGSVWRSVPELAAEAGLLTGGPEWPAPGRGSSCGGGAVGAIW